MFRSKHKLNFPFCYYQTLLEQLKTLYSEIEGLPPDRIVPTVGLNIGRAEAYKSKLIFWDLGGQVYLNLSWRQIVLKKQLFNLW